MAALGAAIDLVHALFMVAWIAGLPLLFVRRWPRFTKYYAVYAVLFVCVNLASRALLDECFLTTIARASWELGSGSSRQAAGEWFTVRLAETVFHLTPTHYAIKRASEMLILVTAAGALFQVLPLRHRRSARRNPVHILHLDERDSQQS